MHVWIAPDHALGPLLQFLYVNQCLKIYLMFTGKYGKNVVDRESAFEMLYKKAAIC